MGKIPIIKINWLKFIARLITSYEDNKRNITILGKSGVIAYRDLGTVAGAGAGAAGNIVRFVGDNDRYCSLCYIENPRQDATTRTTSQ